MIEEKHKIQDISIWRKIYLSCHVSSKEKKKIKVKRNFTTNHTKGDDFLYCTQYSSIIIYFFSPNNKVKVMTAPFVGCLAMTNVSFTALYIGFCLPLCRVVDLIV